MDWGPVAAENLAAVLKMALNVIKNGRSKKDSDCGKRKRAGWDSHYLDQLLLQA